MGIFYYNKIGKQWREYTQRSNAVHDAKTNDHVKNNYEAKQRYIDFF
jgi:hypothetical protein